MDLILEALGSHGRILSRVLGGEVILRAGEAACPVAM